MYRCHLPAVLLLLPALAAAGTARDANLAAVDTHILPRYVQLAGASERLGLRTRAFCAAPAEANLEELRQAFHATMDAWQGIQHLRFGPVELFLRYNRFQLWPDKHNTGSRQLARVLAEADPEQLDPDTFRHASVAIQGLGALERLLFNDAPLAGLATPGGEAGYACRLAEAIAANLADMSAGIVADWRTGATPYRAVIATAAEGNDYFESDREVSARLLNDLHTQLQVIVDLKLLRPLGEGADSARPRRAESWRSERSLANIAVNLEALEELYRAGLAPLLAADPGKVDARLRTAFARARGAAAAIDVPLAAGAASPAARPRLDALLAACRDVKRLVRGPLPEAIGIPLGFNSLDGD